MNKLEFVEHISKDLKITKALAERTIDCITDVIKKKVAKGDYVKLVGFGTFEKGWHKKRTGRNPQTGKKITIPNTARPKFRAGDEFKSMVRNEK